MGDDEANNAYRVDKLRQLARKSATAGEGNNNGHHRGDRGGGGHDRGGAVVLMVQNSHAKVPESLYRPKAPLPDLMKGYCLRTKTQKASEGFYIFKQLSSPSKYIVSKTLASMPDTLYYCRIEPSDIAGCPRQLKREVSVLVESIKAPPENRRHFLKIEGRGRIAEKSFNYLIVAHCDRTLELTDCQFTPSDALRLSVQSYQAVHDLHSLGFVHRNLKPSVFCLRAQIPGEINLYLTSFEHAYRFRKRENGKENRSPKFLFKLKKRRFLPRSYHLSKEILRRDDLESWLYMVAFMIEPLCLNWKNDLPDMNMLSMKERFFCNDFDVEPFDRLPKDLYAIIKYLHKLESDRPDYQFIGILLAEICRKEKIVFSGPFDFESNKFGDARAWITRKLSRGLPNINDKKQRPNKVFDERPASTQQNEDGGFQAPQQQQKATATTSKKRKTKRQRSNPLLPPPPPTAPTDEDPFDMNAAAGGFGEQEEQAPPPPQASTPKPNRVSGAVLKDVIFRASKVDKKKTRRKRRATTRTRSAQPEDAPPPPTPALEVTKIVAPPLPPTQIPAPVPKVAQYTQLTPAETQEPDEGEYEDEKATQQIGEGDEGADGTAAPPKEKKDCQSPPAVYAANKIPKPKEEDPNDEL